MPAADTCPLNLQRAGVGRLKAIRRSADACATVWAFAYEKHKTDVWPTQAEYADYWRISERSAQREWAVFREAFPGEDSPERLARWLLSEVSSHIEDQSSALTVTAPPDLVPA